MAKLPLPEDPALRLVAGQLEAQRYVAEVWDAGWRLAYLTDDYVFAAGAGRGLEEIGLGEPVFSEATLSLRAAWPAGATTDSFMDNLVALAPAIAHDLPGGASELRAGAACALAARLVNVAAAAPAPLQVLRTEVTFGTSTRPFDVAVARLYESGGRFAGTVSLVTPGLPGAVISLLGTGEHATLERMLELLRPARRPGAVMFVDLEGSAQLARRLSTQAFFALIRRLIFRIDEEVVSRGGVVGKHAGDGASAFHELVVRFGLHWGASLYVGRLLTGGRTEITALGEEVNETADRKLRYGRSGAGIEVPDRTAVERLGLSSPA